MKFSTTNENLLKNFFQTKDKEKIILNVEEKQKECIDKLEKAIGTEYSSLVDACNVLDNLWDKVNDIKILNVEISKIANNLIEDIKENNNQENELKQCYDRILATQKELIKIENFVNLKEESNKLIQEIKDLNEEREAYFKITQNILQMENEIKLFKKYYFYGSFLNELNKIKDSFEEILKSNIKQFLGQDWMIIGQNIEINRNFSIFDKIKEETNNICNKKTLKTLYCLKRLEYARLLIEEIILEERKSMFSRVEGHKLETSDKIINFYIGNILLSHILVKIFKGIENFYTHIFKKISDLKIKDINNISKLRLITNKLGISNTLLDQSIETVVYSYFQNEYSCVEISKLEDKEILKRINDGYSFLKGIDSYENEFDEIFLKKLDDSFIFMMNNTSFDTFFLRLENIKKYISELKSKEDHFKNFRFESVSEMKRSILKVVEKQLIDLKKFSEENSTEEVVKKIISYKNIKNEEYRKFFIEKLEQKIDQIFEKRSKEDKMLFIDTAKRNLR